jgi:hypothetical protein
MVFIENVFVDFKYLYQFFLLQKAINTMLRFVRK